MLLISGRTVADNQIDFAQDQLGFWRFEITATGEDITNDIKRMDKIRLVPGFDVEKENIRLSEERGAQAGLGHEPLTTSVAVIAGEQILTDPLAAPMESLNRKLEQLWAMPGIKKAIIGGVIVALLYLAVKKKP